MQFITEIKKDTFHFYSAFRAPRGPDQFEYKKKTTKKKHGIKRQFPSEQYRLKKTCHLMHMHRELAALQVGNADSKHLKRGLLEYI